MINPPWLDWIRALAVKIHYRHAKECVSCQLNWLQTPFIWRRDDSLRINRFLSKGREGWSDTNLYSWLVIYYANKSHTFLSHEEWVYVGVLCWKNDLKLLQDLQGQAGVSCTQWQEMMISGGVLMTMKVMQLGQMFSEYPWSSPFLQILLLFVMFYLGCFT